MLFLLIISLIQNIMDKMENNKVVFHNYLLLMRLLKKKLIFRENKAKKTIKVPLIFFIIVDFLDDDSLYQIKFVCTSFLRNVKNNIKVENRTLKIQINRIRSYWKEVIFIIFFII